MLQTVCTRQALIAEARTWGGTPYHGGASVKGVGVDCIGLVIGVLKNVGLLAPTYSPGYYSGEWHLHQNEERLVAEVEAFGGLQVPLPARQPGDLLLFQFGRVCAHSGFALEDDQVIHAVRDFGQVLVTSLRGEWLERVRRVYVLPGVE